MSFPIGFVHFQFNVGKTDAVAIAALNSQSPGVVSQTFNTFAWKNNQNLYQIKSCVGHNLLKTIIALAVVLRVLGNLSPRMK